MATWLIDTLLFERLSGSTSASVRRWIKASGDEIFLSSASIVLLRAAIYRIPASQKERADTLRSWLDGLATNFPDRIHPIDNEVAWRAAAFLGQVDSIPKGRFHDALLLATAAMHRHTFLTMRDGDFNRVKRAGSVKVHFLE